MIYMAVNPNLAPFRDEPRFQAILRDINYPAEWTARLVGHAIFDERAVRTRACSRGAGRWRARS